MGGSASKSPASSEPAASAETPKKRGCCGCGPGAPVSEDISKYGMMPDEKRKTRDVFCCVLFIIFWIGMLVIGAIGLKIGQPGRLVYGTDYEGKVCGVDVAGKKYVTYPRTNEDFIANLAVKNPLDYKFYGICTDACPTFLEVVCNYNTPGTTGLTQAQKLKCMTDSSYVPPSGTSCSDLKKNCWVTPQTTESTMFRCIPLYNVTNAASSRCVFPEGVTSALDPSCIVAQEDKAGSVQKPAKPNLLFDQLNSARQVWGRWFGDLARAWWVILLCSIGLGLVLGFVWVLFLKYFTGCMVWTTIVSVILLLGCLTGFFYFKAGLINVVIPESIAAKLATIPGRSQAAAAYEKATFSVPQDWAGEMEQYGLSYKGMAYAFTFVTLIVLCIVVAMRGSIRTAIEVIKLGSDALRALPTLLVFPVTNVLAIGVFLVWWVFVAACLQSAGTVTVNDMSKDVNAGILALAASSGLSGEALANATASLLANPSVNNTFTSVKDVEAMNYLIIYHIFGLLWTTQFISGIACMTVAGAVAGWYFSKLPKDVAENPEFTKFQYAQGRTPICSSLYRTLRYYLGSIAFGSLLIAFIQAIRIAFAYIQNKLEKDAKNSAALRFILCCIQCCLKCLQTIVEVVTRNAFIFVAVKGDSFCGAGGRVFKLIINHGSVFAVVNVLGEIIMFLGKILIATSCAFGAYVLLDTLPQFQSGGDSALSSTWLPVLVTLFFGYATAASFMMIFDLSVDTVLVCYVTDIDENLERHGGDGKFKYPIHIDKGALDVQAKLAAKDAESAAKSAAKKGGAATAPSPSAPAKGDAPALI